MIYAAPDGLSRQAQVVGIELFQTLGFYQHIIARSLEVATSLPAPKKEHIIRLYEIMKPALAISTDEYQTLRTNFVDLLKSFASNPSLSKLCDSICKSMSQRAGQLREFALQQDAIVFVSGKQSSNGKYLYSICRSYNPDTFFVSSADELKAGDFLDAQGRNRFARIGVCGATSTPMWLMEDVARHIHQFCPEPTDAGESHTAMSPNPKCTPSSAVPQSSHTAENRPASEESRQSIPASDASKQPGPEPESL